MNKKLSEIFSKYDTIVVVGGGTGGHIQPILNIGEEIKNKKKLIWIGGQSTNEEIEAKKAGIEFKAISTLKLSTTHSPKLLLYPFIISKGFIESRKILQEIGNTACVFSKGGPGSVAIGLAAWSLNIPLYIHESDTIPGRSSRILGKIANKVLLGFEITKKYFHQKKSEVVGQILHPYFENNGKNLPKGESTLSWNTQKTHILVICGSQGAKAIFKAISEQFEADTSYEWIISLGKLNKDMKSSFEKMTNTRAFEWISQKDIASILPSTDITITRGSATTLAEIDAFQVKKIIIPLPIAALDHQYYNAKEYEKSGDILLEQKNIHLLRSEIEKLCQNSQP